MGIRELAKHLNISIGTVSRALNGHKEVNAETRRRVLEAARELGYAPDQSGRSLRKGAINTIVFMLSTSRMGEQDAIFFMELCHGIQTVLAPLELDLVIHLNREGDTMLDRVRRVVERRLADGIILPETREYDPRLDYLATKQFPFCTLGRSLSGGAHPWLDLDFDGAMHQAIARLIARGHRRIGLATGKPGLMLDHILAEAYRREIHAHDADEDADLVQPAGSDEAGGHAVTDWFLQQPRPPTALIFSHHRAVAGAYRRLSAQGLHPGTDIAIVSCAPDSPMAQYLTPSLTCFHLSLRDLGARLAQSLLAVMPAYAEHYPGCAAPSLWPLALVARDSDACGPGPGTITDRNG
ncbi:MAG: LacI family DNA-binding transcriptional regulator [Azospirillaceae bacterium]|nr:LacI family DNA-binding transcriptional regulator [Azospirillaceae bacterium]